MNSISSPGGLGNVGVLLGASLFFHFQMIINELAVLMPQFVNFYFSGKWDICQGQPFNSLSIFAPSSSLFLRLSLSTHFLDMNGRSM